MAPLSCPSGTRRGRAYTGRDTLWETDHCILAVPVEQPSASLWVHFPCPVLLVGAPAGQVGTVRTQAAALARAEDTSWATPIVVEHAGKAQVIVPGTNRLRGYDLA